MTFRLIQNIYISFQLLLITITMSHIINWVSGRTQINMLNADMCRIAKILLPLDYNNWKYMNMYASLIFNSVSLQLIEFIIASYYNDNLIIVRFKRTSSKTLIFNSTLKKTWVGVFVNIINLEQKKIYNVSNCDHWLISFDFGWRI